MINPGCLVQLKKFSRYWNEESVSRDLIIVIHELEVLHEQPLENAAAYDNLPWSGNSNSKQKENVPLASARCYYMDNWTFNVATKSLEYEATHCDLSSIDMSEIYAVKEVATKSKAWLVYNHPALLVKVIRKSRLIHYVTHYRDDKWPFQLPLMVADASGWCSVVLWNKLGLQMVNQIHEGSLLFLKNFRVKTSAQQRTKSFFNPPQGTTVFPCELSLDSTHPATVVRLVSCEPDDDVESLHVPPLEFCFMTRKDLISVPDFTVVDVAGLITFVGRVEREPRKVPKDSVRQHSDSGAFFYRRWVHLRDASLSDPIVTLIYSGEQINTFLSLKPGQYLLCRHMLTNQRLDDLMSSRQKRHGWLSTTTNSWLYVFSPSHMEEIPDSVRDIVQSKMPKHPGECSNQFREGGFFRYPPFPFSIESLKKSNSEMLETVIPSNQWKELFKMMTWRECHQFAVHASLMSISFIRVMNEAPKPVRCSPRKKIRLDQQVPNSEAKDSDGIDINHLGSTQPTDISELWPSVSPGNQSKQYSALLIKWQGLGDPIILNTVKPCALNNTDIIDNFSSLVSGIYDSDFGLIDSVKSVLTSEERMALRVSVQSLVNCKFILLLDVYTNSENHQLVVLNRAFQT